MKNPNLSEILFALVEINELYEDREVSQLSLKYNEDKDDVELIVEFVNDKGNNIEVKTNF